VKATILRCAAVVSLLVASGQPALALPTMIRLGYSECAACHLSPQGGGPLNAYGRSIDRAQSLRGGDYVPATDDFTSTLTFGGRTTQDLRSVFQEQAIRAADGSVQTHFWPRLMYRNVTDIGKGFRVSATVTGETERGPTTSLAYAPGPLGSTSVFVNTALLHYHAGQSLEFAAGRDQLPSGVNVPDLTLWIKARNRLGYYDAPAQVKMFWSLRRVHVTPFAYDSGGPGSPGGNGGGQAAAVRERGAGTLAEVVLGEQRTVLGVSALNGTAQDGDRRMIGGYARLGFGRWGILAEHDVTTRTPVTPASTSFGQNASYGQLFWAVREWLVASAIGERLAVDAPFREKALAGKLELTARLASQATVGVSGRVQRNQITGQLTTSVTFQAALKTVP
jgi:hypothetical protein